MPSIAQATLSTPGKLKRRREESVISSDAPTRPSSQHHHRHAPTLETTPIFSADIMAEPHHIEHNIHPKPRRLHDLKRQRLSLDASHPFERKPLGLSLGNTIEHHTHNIADRGETPRETQPKIDLNPCHLCRRKPTVKSELDQYANCDGCGKRTCYICVRECLGYMNGITALGPDRYDIEGDYDVLALSFEGEESLYDDAKTRSGRLKMESGNERGDEDREARIWAKGRAVGHKRMICSTCCVERGTEGEVWCLGCLRTAEGS